MINIDRYSKIAEELKEDYPKLSDFERLTLAVQIERNKFLQAGLNVCRNNSTPGALEAIAISLGFTP